MEGLTRPVGELPADVYWRRRLIAGAFAVLAILVLYYLVRSLFSGGGTPTPDTSLSPNVSTSTSVASTATTSNPTIDLAAVRRCGADDVTIILTPTTHDWAGTTEPTFEGAVSQVGTTRCVIDTSASDVELLVTSGEVRQWSSRDCTTEPALAPKQILLEPGDTAVLETTWPRVRSQDGCPAGLAAPGPGSYRARLTVQGIQSDQAFFSLTN